MATIESLKTVLMEKASVDTEVISISIKRLCEADLLPSDPEAPVNAENAAALLIAVLTLPLGYAPAEAVAIWGGLALNDAKFSITIGKQFTTEPIDMENHFGAYNVWTFSNALADAIRECQRGEIRPPAELQRLSLGKTGNFPFAWLSVFLEQVENGATISRNATWTVPDHERLQGGDTPPCEVETTININAKILGHFAEVLGDHDSDRRPRADKLASTTQN